LMASQKVFLGMANAAALLKSTATYWRHMMQKYECPCGYVYDPAEGDVDNGIDPGTPFEQLPDAWVCPKCGAEKEHFYPVD